MSFIQHHLDNFALSVNSGSDWSLISVKTKTVHISRSTNAQVINHRGLFLPRLGIVGVAVHLRPSPMNPTLHMHRKLPSVLVHAALTSHTGVVSKHSFLSVGCKVQTKNERVNANDVYFYLTSRSNLLVNNLVLSNEELKFARQHALPSASRRVLDTEQLQ